MTTLLYQSRYRCNGQLRKSCEFQNLSCDYFNLLFNIFKNTYNQQGLKKYKLPGKLVEISRGLQVEDDCPIMMSQKKFVFLKTLHSRALTITAYT